MPMMVGPMMIPAMISPTTAGCFNRLATSAKIRPMTSITDSWISSWTRASSDSLPIRVFLVYHQQVTGQVGQDILHVVCEDPVNDGPPSCGRANNQEVGTFALGEAWKLK